MNHFTQDLSGGFIYAVNKTCLSFSIILYVFYDPFAGSPTKTLLRLLLLLNCKIRTNFYKVFPSSFTLYSFNGIQASTVQDSHPEIQSVEATGGVYKEQGRIQVALMKQPYKAFLVQVR